MIIKQIDNDRFVWPHIMDEISRSMPPYTWLTSLAYLADLVQAITGSDKGGRKARPLDETSDRRALASPAPERLAAACDVLMGRIGDAARVAVAEQALAVYAELDQEKASSIMAEVG